MLHFGGSTRTSNLIGMNLEAENGLYFDFYATCKQAYPYTSFRELQLSTRF